MLTPEELTQDTLPIKGKMYKIPGVGELEYQHTKDEIFGRKIELFVDPTRDFFEDRMGLFANDIRSMPVIYRRKGDSKVDIGYGPLSTGDEGRYLDITVGEGINLRYNSKDNNLVSVQYDKSGDASFIRILTGQFLRTDSITHYHLDIVLWEDRFEVSSLSFDGEDIGTKRIFQNGGLIRNNPINIAEGSFMISEHTGMFEIVKLSNDGKKKIIAFPSNIHPDKMKLMMHPNKSSWALENWDFIFTEEKDDN